MARVIILGGSGFVGRNIAAHLRSIGHSVDAPGRNGVNILYGSRSAGNLTSLMRIIEANAPDWVINCAGVKDVAWCQKNPTETYELNAIGAGRVARACNALGLPLIHLSTDYINTGFIYGRSKHLGDELVMTEAPKAIVCISGGLYGEDAPLLTWFEDKLRRGERVAAYTNVINSPTYVVNLAECLAYMIANRWEKIMVNCVGPQKMSRAELFQCYASLNGLPLDLIEPTLCMHTERHFPADVSMMPTMTGVKMDSPGEGFARMRAAMPRALVAC